MKVDIRRAKLEDVSSIYRLGKATEELSFSPDMIFHDKIELRDFVRKPKDNILLVAILNKQFVGFLYAKIASHTWCILDNIAVDKKYRGMGIGNSLLDTLYRILKAKKVSYIQVLEEIHHKKTREFWHKKGFREEKVFVWADKKLK
jgi:ribosomal protein S18 acetylase RimI-like enzyme